tara:strand:+ start:130 stop:486 length:357 start_codon:yes stop_codon:yes gene_type:complete
MCYSIIKTINNKRRTMSNYEYEVDEYSQDTRSFTLKSNMKLPQDVVDRAYYVDCGINDSDKEVEHDITKEVYDLLKSDVDRDHEDFKGLKVTTRFTDTIYGDDSVVESSGEFLEEENA